MTPLRRNLTDSTHPTTVTEDDVEDTAAAAAAAAEEEEEEEEVVEEEVREMAKKVKEYRSTLPTHLHTCLSSLLSSLRPTLTLSPHLLPGVQVSCSHYNPNPNGESSSSSSTPDDDVKLLTDKIASNISAMSKVLKRMNDCVSRIDSLHSSHPTIHPTFKRKKG
ncbi:hypothetical protein vseg_019041 [Gypsophila vaccaria]